MIAVDTNVLVRLLIDDPSAPEQIDLAKSLLKKARQVFVPQIVQVEVVWVLESAYGYDKAAVITVLKHLQRSVVYVLQQPSQFDEALRIPRSIRIQLVAGGNRRLPVGIRFEYRKRASPD